MVITTGQEGSTFCRVDVLTDLVRAHAGGRSWEDDPEAAITHRNGFLYVSQTPRVHREILELLGRLRK